MAISLVAASLAPVPARSAELASGIEIENISETLAPGEDFYEYVNAKWLETTEIPADQSNYGAFTALDERTKEAVRGLIEKAAADPAAAGPARQVGDFYTSFMDVQRRNARGVEPLRPYLQKIREANTLEAWVSTMGQLSRIGVDNPLGYYVEPDARKSDQYAAYVVQSGITLPDRDYYLEDSPQFEAAREAMLGYAAAMLAKAGWEEPAAAARGVLELETAIARAQWTNTQLRDPIKNYNKVEVAEFAAAHPNLHWAAYSNIVDLPGQGSIVVGQPDFFDGVDRVLAEADIATLRSYAALHLLDQFADVLDAETERLHFEFHSTALSGVTEQEPLWKRGVQACNSLLGMPVGKLYVDEHFSAAAKERMNELVDNLKRAFAVRIRELDWMGEGTKGRALEKLELIATKIGYPDRWKDYSSVEVGPETLFENVVAIAEFEHGYQLGKLGEPVDRGEWHMPPQTVNAYYNPVMNEIVFPAAILQPPFFNMQADDAVNYGAIGAVIGHEISHAFDDSGSRFDGHGNLQNWWTEQDRAEFEARAAKLVEQYAAYRPFPDAALNGELTLGENIGDLGGLSAAYTAYRLSLDGGPAPVIDGLTGTQRFFMGWAQVWRRKYREQELRKRLLTDPHSPSRYRANGIVSNLDAFYEAFEVAPSQTMFIPPEQRVRIW